jgi:hypothetical protein
VRALVVLRGDLALPLSFFLDAALRCALFLRAGRIFAAFREGLEILAMRPMPFLLEHILFRIKPEGRLFGRHAPGLARQLHCLCSARKMIRQPRKQAASVG